MSADMLDLYVVRWPQQEMIKVGVSKNERWQDFGAGVELIFTLRAPRGVALALEARVHQRLSQLHPRPFRRASQAVTLLGTKGAGFTECYVDDGHTLTAVVDALTKQGGLHLALNMAEEDDHSDMDAYLDAYNDGWSDGISATFRWAEGSGGPLMHKALRAVVDGLAWPDPDENRSPRGTRRDRWES
jgi:hypothetical protein